MRLKLITIREDLECKRGNPFMVNVYLRGVDPTGYHARLQVRALDAVPQDGALLVELSDEGLDPGIVISATTDPHGIDAALFACVFTADQLIDGSGTYNYVLRTIDADDEPRDAVEGKFIIDVSTYAAV